MSAHNKNKTVQQPAPSPLVYTSVALNPTARYLCPFGATTVIWFMLTYRPAGLLQTGILRGAALAMGVIPEVMGREGGKVGKREGGGREG